MSDTSRSSVRRWLRAENRYVVVVAIVIVLVGVIAGGHLYGRFLSARDLGGRDNVIEQLRAENQKLKRSGDEKSAKLTEMQVKLNGVQSALEAIMPIADTYNLNPNQTLIVADGHLMIGMIGSPANEGIMLDVNGKQQTVTAGQVISVAPDGSTQCRLAVQSFDMFKAVIHAKCDGSAKQQQ